MAEFLPAFERMIRNEGGFVLSKHPLDKGGQTYAGIARNRHPHWVGWPYIDRGETPPTQLVAEFYREVFWEPINADQMPQAVAQSIFDFAVNAGTRTAAILAQTVVGTTPDGIIGPKTLGALNAYDVALFQAQYALAKIARYAAICNRDPSQRAFLLGWINRTLREAA